jgi:hypothetical protein
MPEYANHDAALTNCVKELISKMLPDKKDSDFVVTDIWKQYKNIDVLVVVNRDTYLIIEDKTFTKQHGDQINRYAQTVRDVHKTEPVCVYYKIVEQARPEPNVLNITRADMLPTFRKYDSANQIFRNYVAYLEYIDSLTNAYKTKPISEWDKEGYAHRGFFTHLTKNGVLGAQDFDWGYVSNPTGGFWGLWWDRFSADKLAKANLRKEWLDTLYLQIENDIIAFKIAAGNIQDKIIQDCRWQLYEYLKKELSGYNFIKKTFRRGNHMSVGYIKYSEKDYAEKIKLMETIMQKIVNGDFVYREKTA